MFAALDTETFPVTNAEPIPRLVSVSICNGHCHPHTDHGVELYPAHAPGLEERVRDAFQEGLFFAGAPFDVTVFFRAFPQLQTTILDAYDAGRVLDVLTRERLIDISLGQFRRVGGYDLGSVSHRRAAFEVDKNDDWRLKYGTLIGLEIDQWPAGALTYAKNDALATWLTAKAQDEFAATYCPVVLNDAANQARGHIALYWQSILGINTDPERVEALYQKLWREQSELTLRLIRHGLARVQGKAKPKITRNAKAAQQMLAHLKNTEQLTGKLTKTKTGVSLSEDALLTAGIPKDHPLQDYRRVGVIKSAIKKNIIAFRHPVVRTRYHELMATGRTSSAAPPAGFGWAGTNLQNLPREGGFRECLIPPPGCAFVSTDWSQAELVAFAQIQMDLFGHSKLAQAFREGRDPHADLAMDILGLPHDAYDPENPLHIKTRQLAKIPNFGYLGGMGPRKFVIYAASAPHYLTITEDYSKWLKQVWRDAWPEAKLYHDWVGTHEDAIGFYRIVQPRSGRIRGGCTFTEACNTGFQGFAADAAKLALWWLFRAGFDPASPMYECTQRLFAHDENVTVAPIERAEAVKAEQERIMIAAFAHWCPDVPIKVETMITDRYTKG